MGARGGGIWVGGPWLWLPCRHVSRGGRQCSPWGASPSLPALCWAQSSWRQGPVSLALPQAQAPGPAVPSLNGALQRSPPRPGPPFTCPLYLELSSCSSSLVTQEWSAWWKKGLRILGSLPPLGGDPGRTLAFPL